MFFLICVVELAVKPRFELSKINLGGGATSDVSPCPCGSSPCPCPRRCRSSPCPCGSSPCPCPRPCRSSPCPCGSIVTLIIEQFISRTLMSQTEWTEEIMYCWLSTAEIQYCWLAFQCLQGVLLTLMLSSQFHYNFKGYCASHCRL